MNAAQQSRAPHGQYCLQALIAVLCATHCAHAFPSLFVSSYANGCTDMPTKAYGGHQAPADDPYVPPRARRRTSSRQTCHLKNSAVVHCRSMTFTFTTPSNRPVLALCPGVQYILQVRECGVLRAQWCPLLQQLPSSLYKQPSNLFEPGYITCSGHCLAAQRHMYALFA